MFKANAISLSLYNQNSVCIPNPSEGDIVFVSYLKKLNFKKTSMRLFGENLNTLYI